MTVEMQTKKLLLIFYNSQTSLVPGDPGRPAYVTDL